MRTFVLGLPVAALLLAGCGPGEEKVYRVSGTASFQGKPIPRGTVHFDPLDGGPQGYAEIHNGRFDTAVAGKGVRGGEYGIRLQGFDGKEAQEAPFGAALFNEHHEKRSLPAADSEQQFDPGPPKKK